MRLPATELRAAARSSACLAAVAIALVAPASAHAASFARTDEPPAAEAAQGAPAAREQDGASGGGSNEVEPNKGDASEGERSGDDPSRNRRGARMLPPDWPRAGGFGPDAERPMIEGLVLQGLLGPGEQRRVPSDAEIERAIAVAKEISPEWGAALEARAKEEPGRMRAAFGGGARRLLALVALKDRAPKVYSARVEELKAQATTARAASELRAAEEDSSASAEKKAALAAAFDAAVARQVDATLAARSEELDALEARLAALRGNLAADRAKHAELVEGVKAQARDAGAREASPGPASGAK
jgi:hypothetical protein